MLDFQSSTLWTNIAIVYALSLMMLCEDYKTMTLMGASIWAAVLILFAVGAQLTLKNLECEGDWKKLKEFRSAYGTILLLILAWSFCFSRLGDSHMMRFALALVAAVIVALFAFLMYYSKKNWGYIIPVAVWVVLSTGFSFYKM